MILNAGDTYHCCGAWLMIKWVSEESNNFRSLEMLL